MMSQPYQPDYPNIDAKWTLLNEAYHVMRRGQVSNAIVLYEQSLKTNPLAVYASHQHPTGYLIGDCPKLESPSLNGALWMYTPFFSSQKVWGRWFDILNPIRQHIDEFPLIWQARMWGSIGLAYCSQGWSGEPAQVTIERSKAFLKQSDNLDIETRLIHMLIVGRMSRTIRQYDDSVRHMEQAMEEVPFEERFWRNYLIDNLGAVYYFFNDQNPTYFEKSLQYYTWAGEDAIETNGADYSLQGYNDGWTLIEQNRFDEAKATLTAGLEDANAHFGQFDIALYHYALGYLVHQMGDIELAKYHLNKAARTFWFGDTHSPLYLGMCQFMLAGVFLDSGETDKAIDYSCRSIKNLSKTNHTVQQMHAYLQLAKSYTAKGDIWRTIKAYVTWVQKRRQANKSLLPPFVLKAWQQVKNRLG